jgi:hypothetical protein
MCENGKMRPVENSLRWQEAGQKKTTEGVNLTTICCKHFCKCYNVPEYNNNMIIKIKQILKVQH